MKTGNWSSRWLIVLAVGNALVLIAIAVGVWRMRGEDLAGPVPVAPSGAPQVVHAPPIGDPPPPPPGMRKKLPLPPSDEIVIDLDGEGRIRLAGEPMDLGMLRMRLCQLHAEYRRRAVVTIRASDDCLFRHVRDVMNVCDECVISSHLSSPPAPGNPSRPSWNDTSAV